MFDFLAHPRGQKGYGGGKAAIAWVSDSLPNSSISPPVQTMQRQSLQERPWERRERLKANEESPHGSR